MTEAFASALTVSIPIFALAAGAEARSVRDRLRKPDVRWEKEFAAYREEHELSADSVGSAAEFFRGVPGPSRLYLAERIVAVAGAIIWLVVFVLLGIAEMLSLIWLADGAPRGDGGLATFALFTVGAALLALIVAPAAYLLLPVLLPLDLMPEGLRKTVQSRLGILLERAASPRFAGSGMRGCDRLVCVGQPVDCCGQGEYRVYLRLDELGAPDGVLRADLVGAGPIISSSLAAACFSFPPVSYAARRAHSSWA